MWYCRMWIHCKGFLDAAIVMYVLFSFSSSPISIELSIKTKLDQTEDENQLFRIGKANDEFIIKDKQAMVELCDSLIEMKKRNSKIFITTKLLKALRTLFLEDKRTWTCRALQNFLVLDHLGRIAGCHNHNFVGSVFDLPKMWNSDEFNLLRKTYNGCTQCAYLCYIFYSLHGSPYGNLVLAKDQWKNSRFLLER